ncbi:MULTISPECIES: SWIM zinc finger domain-containing protein [unclassified Methanosarcina]|uniref:SWIM zinc finger domain-containing protein n=1 Tax=unclassified Methanosarcina TaxID=2644672 RepID=UPI0006154EF8|nr:MULTISPECIES: SWIM zinc finger domain-containing protein [unclassified Methanosarcina]AKB17189.1 hypothetical protein MSWHS_0326 [Methanosarcina sp. WWM596]AKB20594.1 hypothetical protein MSWH1_0323 [Methanosarcina sp. WH1]
MEADTSILPGTYPPTELLEPDSFIEIKTSVFDLLIKISIGERAPDGVVRWYGELKKGGETTKRYAYYIDKNKIANAVHEKYPDIALEVWKKLAEELISKTNVNAYREAAVHLRKVKDNIESRGQKREWEIYPRGIREKNKRKRRLIEILGTLGKNRHIED